MKLNTLRKMERAAYALLRAAEAERKTDSRAAGLYQNFCKLWQERRTEYDAANVAAAIRRDKGQTLVTVFVPDQNCIQEIELTPHRKISTFHWRRGWPVTTHFEHNEPSTEVFASRKSHDWDFDFYMHTVSQRRAVA